MTPGVSSECIKALTLRNLFTGNLLISKLNKSIIVNSLVSNISGRWKALFIHYYVNVYKQLEKIMKWGKRHVTELTLDIKL